MIPFIGRYFNKKRNPKDYAYSIFSEFGPALRIDRQTRIERLFPRHSSSEIREWLKEFKEVDNAVWIAAEAGGTLHNDRIQINDFLSSRFSWLTGVGLKTALNRCDYFAWHEGYHDRPLGTLDEQAGDAGKPDPAAS